MIVIVLAILTSVGRLAAQESCHYVDVECTVNRSTSNLVAIRDTLYVNADTASLKFYVDDESNRVVCTEIPKGGALFTDMDSLFACSDSAILLYDGVEWQEYSRFGFDLSDKKVVKCEKRGEWIIVITEGNTVARSFDGGVSWELDEWKPSVIKGFRAISITGRDAFVATGIGVGIIDVKYGSMYGLLDSEIVRSIFAIDDYCFVGFSGGRLEVYKKKVNEHQFAIAEEIMNTSDFTSYYSDASGSILVGTGAGMIGLIDLGTLTYRELCQVEADMAITGMAMSEHHFFVMTDRGVRYSEKPSTDVDPEDLPLSIDLN